MMEVADKGVLAGAACPRARALRDDADARIGQSVEDVATMHELSAVIFPPEYPILQDGKRVWHGTVPRCMGEAARKRMDQRGIWEVHGVLGGEDAKLPTHWRTAALSC